VGVSANQPSRRVIRIEIHVLLYSFDCIFRAPVPNESKYQVEAILSASLKTKTFFRFLIDDFVAILG
jgi:hypothetical protein